MFFSVDVSFEAPFWGVAEKNHRRTMLLHLNAARRGKPLLPPMTAAESLPDNDHGRAGAAKQRHGLLAESKRKAARLHKRHAEAAVLLEDAKARRREALLQARADAMVRSRAALRRAPLSSKSTRRHEGD